MLRLRGCSTLLPSTHSLNHSLAVISSWIGSCIAGLLVGARRGDDLRAGRLGELHGEDAHAAGSLRENPLLDLEPCIAI